MAEIRLAKITKQYSIGLGKLVGFLNGIGANVELNPNVKISDEYLPAIEEKFGEERKLKEAADVVTIKLKEIISKGSKNPVHDERIFISYSRKDKDLVLSIVDHIQKAVGVKCWIDEKGIESGEQFKDVIMAAIDKCEIVIFMMSENSLKSSFAKKEVNYADHMKKRIVPVILDGDELRGWFVFDFAGADYIIASNPEHVAKLIRNLKSWLGTDNICYEPHEMEHFSLSNATVSSLHPTNEVNLKVLTNLNCKVLIDCEEKGIAQADHLTKIPLPIGEYYAEFVSTENSADALSREIILEHDKLEKVDLLSLKQTREKAEEERIARIKSMTLIPYISNNKVGFADLDTCEIMIPCQYEWGRTFHNDLANVKMNGKYGVIDRFGREITSCKYDDEISLSFTEDFVRVIYEGKWGFIDKTGSEVVPCKYDHVGNFHEGLANVELNDKCGFIDKLGRDVIPCRFDRVGYFHEGLASVQLNGKRGFIDKTGSEVVPCKYDLSYEFFEGFASVKMDGKWGVIDRSGCEIVSCKYDESCVYVEDLARIVYNGKWGFIDKLGNVAVPCKYDHVGDFHEGLASVELNDKCGFIDKLGRDVIPCRFDRVGDFHEGLASVQLNGKWGFIDRSGNETILCRYDSAGEFNEGRAIVKNNKQWWYIDKLGNSISNKYDSIYYINNHYVRVELNGKWGIIDKELGSQIIPCKYDYDFDFRDELIVVKKNGKCGLVRKSGRDVVPCRYDRVGYLHKGLMRVEYKGKWGFIDRSGREVIPCRYERVGDFSDGLASVTLNNKSGYIDELGREVISLKYDTASIFTGGLAIVRLNGKWGYIDRFGNEMWPEE